MNAKLDNSERRSRDTRPQPAWREPRRARPPRWRRSRDTRPQPAWRGPHPATPRKAALLLLSLALPALAAEAPVRTANGLVLPAPAGFQDAASHPELSEFVRLANEADRQNRTYANFFLAGPAGIDMDANVKVARQLDGKLCDRSVLRQFAEKIAAPGPAFERGFEKGVREAADRRSKGLSETFGVEETFSGPRILPVHRTTPRSTHFSLTCDIRSVDESAETEATQVVASSLLWLRGRILSLNVSTSIADPDEPGALDAALARTRDALRGWEEAVVASNALLRLAGGDPVSDPAELAAEDEAARREAGGKLLTARNVNGGGCFSFERLWLNVALGALVGGIVGLVNAIRKRRRARQPPPAPQNDHSIPT